MTRKSVRERFARGYCLNETHARWPWKNSVDFHRWSAVLYFLWWLQSGHSKHPMMRMQRECKPRDINVACCVNKWLLSSSDNMTFLMLLNCLQMETVCMPAMWRLQAWHVDRSGLPCWYEWSWTMSQIIARGELFCSQETNSHIPWSTHLLAVNQTKVDLCLICGVQCNWLICCVWAAFFTSCTCTCTSHDHPNYPLNSQQHSLHMLGGCRLCNWFSHSNQQTFTLKLQLLLRSTSICTIRFPVHCRAICKDCLLLN